MSIWGNTWNAWNLTWDTRQNEDIAIIDSKYAPLKGLIIDITAVQSGSGDPSSLNVRPINGFTGTTIYNAGINVFGGNSTTNAQYVGHYSIAGSEDSYAKESNENYNCFTVPVWPETSYTMVLDSGGKLYKRAYIRFLGKDKTFLSGTDSGYDTTSYTITTPTNCYYIEFAIGANAVIDVAINYPATNTTYTKGQSTFYSISWNTEAGTVYGGTLNVTTGELTVTHGNIASYDDETINEPWISSMDVYTSGGTPSTGAQVVYPLAAPITYQLSPMEIYSLVGTNYFWNDTGNINSITYRTSVMGAFEGEISDAIGGSY